MTGKIPLSVIVTTLNEAKTLPRCLAALERFDEVIVVDSMSLDGTADIARSMGAPVVPFQWNGQYPKKRQWCLDTLALKHERVFFVDADEELTPELCGEIAALDWKASGYFIKGNYVVNGRVLCFGLNNAKLCLFDRRRVHFPVVDDLDLAGMGEIEGHYQPVFKHDSLKTGTLKHALRHHALDDIARHAQRHEEYSEWARGMDRKKAFPADPRTKQRMLKKYFAGFPARSMLFFVYYYFVKLGMLEYPDNVEIYRQKKRYHLRRISRNDVTAGRKV